MKGPNNHFYFNPAFNIKNLITQHGLLCESLLLYIIGKLSICLGLLLGSLTILTVANKFGRKSAFALASLVQFSGAILQVAFYDYWVIFYVGVFFNNLCKWSLLQLCYIYLTEVAVLRKPVIGWISLNSLVRSFNCYKGEMNSMVRIKCILLLYSFNLFCCCQ